MSAGTKITLIHHEIPEEKDVNNLIQWYGASIGLFAPRDKDSSCFRVFVVLLRDVTSGDDGLRSEAIAERTDLSRGTVVHHLNKLREKGIVAKADNEYFIKVNSLQALTDELRRDVNDALDDIEDVAQGIDDQLGLNT